MDPRRLLSAAALTLALGGCALFHPAPPASIMDVTAAVDPAQTAPSAAPPVVAANANPNPASEPTRAPDPEAAFASASTARPYLTPTRPPREPGTPRLVPAGGRAAIAAANREARAPSSADAFVGGVRVFAWDPGRVYDVWAAPLRVTSLSLAPGETVTAKAAGDTIRWQIGESRSGSGAGTRVHILIKPLQAGLETNLVLTTSQRVYLLTLRSGDADAFNAAIAWDYGVAGPISSYGSDPVGTPEALPSVDVAAVTPQGPLDARYRIEPRGRTPRWAPTAVFNDGLRTFIALSPDVAVDETPALFVLAAGGPQLVNYRQAGSLLIVDRVFDEAELRLGDRRPQIVHIRRLPGAVR